MTTHRFFATDDATYEAMRAAVDSAWGYPTSETLTCVPPAVEQWHDASGRVVIALTLEWLAWEPVPSMIAGALAAGVVIEIDEATFWAAAPQMEM
jgi:hypothetical protein